MSEEGTAPDTSGQEAAEAPADTQQPIGGSDPEGRPDWLPEKFWDADVGPRTEVLAKSFTELEAKLRTKHDDLKSEVLADMKAAAPESYEIKLSDELKIPESVDLDLKDDDPLVSWFFGFAKDQGLSQDTVTDAINKYVEIELANMPDMEAEIGKLGDHGQDRLLRVHNWMEGRLSEGEFAALNPLLSSAAQVEALEKLMKSSGPANFDGENKSQALTLDELRTMQNDPKYWQDKDPAFIKKVEDGYKRLYGAR